MAPRTVLRETRSLCSGCLKVIPAKIVKEDRIYLVKECPEHGKSKIPHLWEQPPLFHLRDELHRDVSRSANGLVLNLTGRCNQQCPFCFASAGPNAGPDLDMETIQEYLDRFKGSIIYLSGGEPTTREDLFDIVQEVNEKGFTCALFTNGKKLADRSYVNRLKEVKVSFVILQFDTLDQETCTSLRGKETRVEEKCAAIHNLQCAGIPTYLFSMVVKGENDTEIPALLSLAADNPGIKILNFQPVWDLGRTAPHDELSTFSILRLVQDATGLTDEDFVQSTRFTFYLSEVVSAMRGQDINTHPNCETKCYVTFKDGEIEPVTQHLDLKDLADILRWICKKRQHRIALVLRASLASPLLAYHVIKSIVMNPGTLSWLLSCGRAFLKSSKSSVFSALPFRSIIVGAFPTAENIDLDMTNTCNLHSDMLDSSKEDKQGMTSACMRQILLNHRSRTR